MLGKLTAALCGALAIATWTPEVAAQAAPEHARSGAYYGLNAGLIVGFAASATLLPRVLSAPASGIDFSFFPGDASVRAYHSSAASRTSDLLLLLTLAAPVFENLALGANTRLANASVVYAETIAANDLLNVFNKVAIRRRRPYTYWTEAGSTTLTQDRGDWYVSFYSGHASTTFAAGISGALLFAEASHDRSARAAVWASELALATTTAGLRVRAGKHYYSDVLVGALVGSAFGVGIPLLHGSRYTPSAAEWIAGGSGVLVGTAVSSLLPFHNDSVPTQTMQMLSPLVQPGVAGVQARGVF